MLLALVNTLYPDPPH